MPRRLKTPPRNGRYTYEQTVRNVLLLLDRRPRGARKNLSDYLGFTHQSQLTGRLETLPAPGKPKRAYFTLEQWGLIADWADAPPDSGFPFVAWKPGWDRKGRI